MKWFGNDSDGFTKKDLEKIVLCFVFVFLSIIIGGLTIYNTIFKTGLFIDGNIIAIYGLVVASLTGRKMASDWGSKKFGEVNNLNGNIQKNNIDENVISNEDQDKNLGI